MTDGRVRVADAVALWSRTLAEGGPVPFGLALVACGINAAAALHHRLAGTAGGWARWAELAALYLLGLAVTGLVVARLARLPLSPAGLGRYAAACTVLFAPFLAGLGLWAAWPGPPGGAALLVGTGVALVLATWLPDWPGARLALPRCGGPVRTWRATRGHRLPLFLLAVFGSGGSRLLPALGAVRAIRAGWSCSRSAKRWSTRCGRCWSRPAR